VIPITDTQNPASRRKVVLLAVLLVALVGWWGYYFWSTRKSNVKPIARKTSDFLVDWRCLACDHVISDRAGPGPTVCPNCGEPQMYASLQWACHGVHNVAFQYDQNGDPIQIKIGDGEWQPAFSEDGGWNIRCPKCGEPMSPATALRPAPRQDDRGE
jgi:predicted RNA-binding Zn-ribbon protein involved in translation (DUF1610 family)